MYRLPILLNIFSLSNSFQVSDYDFSLGLADYSLQESECASLL